MANWVARQIAKCQMRNAKCEMQNAKCEMLNAKLKLKLKLQIAFSKSAALQGWTLENIDG